MASDPTAVPVLSDFPPPPGAPPELLIELPTRPGVTQRFAYIAAPEARATIILFPGGPGVIGLNRADDGGDGDRAVYGRDVNFLVRSRFAFAAAGLSVATMDAPSDRQGAEGMLGGFRNSADHAADIDAAIAWLTAETGLPVWLVGTSRGTESAAYAALHHKAPVAGLVLTSTLTVTNDHGVSVLDLPLGEISLPVYIAAHREDACKVTPPADAGAITLALKGAPRVEMGLFEGGDPPQSGPCDPLCPHGFFGIEQQVVNAISTFIE